MQPIVMSIKFEELKASSKTLGVITLDRPKAINSLNLEMCQQMADKIAEWSQNDEISCIFLHGSGDKGFCAGGDVKLVREAIVKSKSNEKSFSYVTGFFEQEYRNDFQLTQINKPIICWANGITMGGGMGLMQGCAYRIVTETSVMAMPEISIGLYPDVGSLYFLSKLPRGVGLFLALTGARFGPHDAIELELADFYIKSETKQKVLEELKSIEWNSDIGANHEAVQKILLKNKFPIRLRATIGSHIQMLSALANCQNVHECYSLIEGLAKKSPWVAESFEFLKKGSPLSAAIIFEYFKRAKNLARRDVFIQDLYLSLNCSLNNDFPEGVRAVLVDKDQMPNWEYKELSSVPDSVVMKYFEKPSVDFQIPF